jgi:hypothetical protein
MGFYFLFVFLRDFWYYARDNNCQNMTNANAPSSDINTGSNRSTQTKSNDTLLSRLLQDSVSTEISAHEPTGLNVYEKDTDGFNTRLRVLMKDKRDQSRA